MKATTAAQLTNAVAAALAGKGVEGWVVRSTYTRGGALTASKPMTYREAVANARAIREAAGYANVERA